MYKHKCRQVLGDLQWIYIQDIQRLQGWRIQFQLGLSGNVLFHRGKCPDRLSFMQKGLMELLACATPFQPPSPFCKPPDKVSYYFLLFMPQQDGALEACFYHLLPRYWPCLTCQPLTTTSSSVLIPGYENHVLPRFSVTSPGTGLEGVS